MGTNKEDVRPFGANDIFCLKGLFMKKSIYGYDNVQHV